MLFSVLIICWHCYLLGGGSLFLRHFLTCMHLSVLHWILLVRKIHIFILCAVVSSYESCPVKSWCLGLPRFSASSLQFRGISGLYLNSVSLFHSLGTLSEQWAWVIVRLISFVFHLSEITALHWLISSVLKTAVSLNMHFTFKFKLIQIQIYFFSHMSHISSAQLTYVARGYHIGQHRSSKAHRSYRFTTAQLIWAGYIILFFNINIS